MECSPIPATGAVPCWDRRRAGQLWTVKLTPELAVLPPGPEA